MKTVPLGQQIREARKAAGLTQVEAGRKAAFARGQTEVSEIERGKYDSLWEKIQTIRRAVGLKTR